MSNWGRREGRKAALRERMIAERAALPAPARAEGSAAVAAWLSTLTDLAEAGAVLGYAAFGSELDLDPYLAHALDAGQAVYLPWVDGEELRITRVRNLEEDLAPGWRGVREPRAERRRAADPTVLDAVVAPGLAFDRRGNRLGYGGGHFDRLLARMRPGTLVVGVGFDVQLVDAVPAEGHDAPVSVVVTESGIMWPD